MSENKPTPAITLDDAMQEIGYHRLKGESDDDFRKRVANRIEREEWITLARHAHKRLLEIIRDQADTDAAEISAIRTALERAEGAVEQTVIHSGPGGGPIPYQIINYGGDDDIGKNHADIPA